MNLTQTIEATVEFWKGHYEVVGVLLTINVYNQLRTENNVFIVQASQIISGSAAAQIAGVPVVIVPGPGCFQVITGEPLPAAEFYDPNVVWSEPINDKAMRAGREITLSHESFSAAIELYRGGLISIKDFRAEFLDDAPPPGLVWES